MVAAVTSHVTTLASTAVARVMRSILWPIVLAWSPSLAWNTTLPRRSFHANMKSGFLRSSVKKNRASDRRAASTRWLPAFTKSLVRVMLPATVTNPGANVPSAASSAK